MKVQLKQFLLNDIVDHHGGAYWSSICAQRLEVMLHGLCMQMGKLGFIKTRSEIELSHS